MNAIGNHRTGNSIIFYDTIKVKRYLKTVFRIFFCICPVLYYNIIHSLFIT